MANRINFTISIETNTLSHEDYMELQTPFYSRIVDDESKAMSFDEINAILKLDEKKYFVAGIQFPLMIRNNDFEIKETNIEIKA